MNILKSLNEFRILVPAMIFYSEMLFLVSLLVNVINFNSILLLEKSVNFVSHAPERIDC